MNERECTVLLAVQQALLGEVAPSLRVVTVTYDETKIHLDCFYDQEVTDDDRESMSCVETELMALFPPTHRITHRVHRKDYPELIPKDKVWAYFRKEPVD